jgi:hypothetical protein
MIWASSSTRRPASAPGCIDVKSDIGLLRN